MRIVAYTSLEDIAPLAEAWDRLAAGVPLRSWTWASTWWRHYGADPRRRLCVLACFDARDRLAGIAPWYLARSATQGRVIRWLGSGEVCSDYLTVLCWPDDQERVAAALAEHLSYTTDLEGDMPAWNLLELDSVMDDDRTLQFLGEQLAERGAIVHRRPREGCWRLLLPGTWNDYEAMLSKSHRKQVRRLDRDLLQSGQAVLHTVTRTAELPQALEVLVDLHQRRRRAQGQAGCFASPRFTAFHREVMPLMLAAGQLQLHWLELIGKPVAAEYHLFGEGISYAYQAGIEPECLGIEPGRLITLAILKKTIAEGDRAVDFLRGDEPYKAHFRAEPRPCHALRIVADRPAARLRHRVWLAGRRIKQWVE